MKYDNKDKKNFKEMVGVEFEDLLVSIFEFMEIIDEIKERLLRIDLLYIFSIINLFRGIIFVSFR